MTFTDSARWERVQAIFHAALESPAEKRAQVIQDLCGGDDSLEREAWEILGEDQNPGGLLNEGVSSLADRLIQFPEQSDGSSRLEKEIGPYRIVRMLGEGGMGVVYLAERTDVGGLVAIKFLRDAGLSPERRRRFALEQKTLAHLNHPSIARLYDADSLVDGTPWFVMEYVDGVPLTRYWAERRGTVEDCLRLLRSVCEPVLYAHSRAVIHRDLKPSNVLVNADGKVKLLDFGIAKQLDDVNGELTITGLRAMTPAYSAPEQQQGGQVGVFTDVYALGVLLYELLTGKLPFDGPVSLRALDAEPVKPSSLASPDRFEAPVSRSEWADLNSICMAAMRTEVERRYVSVEALIRDIDAFLEKRPLAARSNRWSYHFRKYVRRHRARISYALATVLLIAGLISFYTERLRSARNQALAEAARTQRIQQFTANLFQGGDPSAGPAEDLRVSTLLDRGREEAQRLEKDPEMQADMWETLGDIYRKLGDPQRADPLLSAALEKRRATFGPRSPKVAQTLVVLGLVRMNEAKLDDAQWLVQEGLDIDRDVSHGKPDTESAVAADLTALGTVLQARGKYQDAIDVLSQALQLRPRGDAMDADLAANMRELANAHFYAGDYPTAESLNRQVLAIHRRIYGDRHPEVAEDMDNLGAIQHSVGNLHEAEADFRNALAITEAWYGAEHPHTAEELTSLGRTLVAEKKLDDAKPLLERALRIQTGIHGQNHPAVASALNELGNLACARNDDVEAEARFSAALEIWRTVYGENHQFVAVGLSNLGSVYLDKKDYRRAEAMYRQAVKVFTATVGDDHVNTAIAHLKLGRALLRQKRYADAEKETLRGYTTLQKLVTPENGFLIAGRKDLSAIYTGLGRNAEAHKYLAQ